LPGLPFRDREFDLTLVSYFLLVYEDKFDYAFHQQSLLEIMRVTRGEARLYPIVNFEARRCSYIERFKSDPALQHLRFSEVETDFEFLVGSNFFFASNTATEGRAPLEPRQKFPRRRRESGQLLPSPANLSPLTNTPSTQLVHGQVRRFVRHHTAFAGSVVAKQRPTTFLVASNVVRRGQCQRRHRWLSVAERAWSAAAIAERTAAKAARTRRARHLKVTWLEHVIRLSRRRISGSVSLKLPSRRSFLLLRRPDSRLAAIAGKLTGSICSVSF
jgi:hypothetical protein